MGSTRQKWARPSIQIQLHRPTEFGCLRSEHDLHPWTQRCQGTRAERLTVDADWTASGQRLQPKGAVHMQ